MTKKKSKLSTFRFTKKDEGRNERKEEIGSSGEVAALLSLGG